MASTEILSQTLHSITSIKLSQLHKQKRDYESAKSSLLDEAMCEANNKKRAKILIEGVEDLPTMTPVDDSPMISLENLKLFVDQARYDPSIPDSFLGTYENALRNELDMQSAKYSFAELYGKLVTEWIEAGKIGADDREAGFVPVGREEMHEQRATWEEYVLKAKETDPKHIKAYLKSLFQNSKDVQVAFKKIVESLEEFQEAWDNETHFSPSTVADAIQGLLKSDSLTDQKRATLGDFKGNNTVLTEIADVLNMRMHTRKSWKWEGFSYIEQFRQLNGRYRFYPDEDLLHMIFLHYIGKRWAVKMREVLIEFAGNGAFKLSAKPMTASDLRRRQFFLDNEQRLEWSNVEGKLAYHFSSEILLDQLPQSMAEARGSYNSDQEEGNTAGVGNRKGHHAIVQNLLHILQSQIIMQRRLGKDLTVVRSDFRWFGPSLPHSTIFAVLEFFEIESEWISFFKRVLECPLRFRQDPVDSEPQIRKRGTPLSSPLADFLSESTLFCLDFAVNQKADGVRLYRLHDDMWLWGSQETCVKGWKAMTEFANIMGLDFNEDKTGSAVILKDGTAAARVPSALPKGDVVWGFLRLDAPTGKFVIDVGKVDQHIDELRLQLHACKSVLDLVQAWNIYAARFFEKNFGTLANCHSRDHLDNILKMFQRVQEKVFGSGGIAGRIKSIISERFAVSDIPDGYLYFPVDKGGLGLDNPIIKLCLKRENLEENLDEIMDTCLEEEEAEYEKLKAAFERPGDGTAGSKNRLQDASYADLKDEPFFSFEEFTRYRETTSLPFFRAFSKLGEIPDDVDVQPRGEVFTALGTSFHQQWNSMSNYQQWVCSLYGRDMIARFGSLTIIERGLLPIGLMEMLKQSRFQWQG
jgi:hypothetical protein